MKKKNRRWERNSWPKQRIQNNLSTRQWYRTSRVFTREKDINGIKLQEITTTLQKLTVLMERMAQGGRQL